MRRHEAQEGGFCAVEVWMVGIGRWKSWYKVLGLEMWDWDILLGFSCVWVREMGDVSGFKVLHALRLKGISLFLKASQ
jgi:hypothetical protein